MKAKTLYLFVPLLVLLLAMFWIVCSRTAGPSGPPAQQTASNRSPHQAAREGGVADAASAAMPQASSSGHSANLQWHKQAADVPAWTIPYGKAFWRRPATERPSHAASRPPAMFTPASVNLGDVIERVSHAIPFAGTNAHPQLQAETYSASFDGQGLRFSPHRPMEPFGVPPSGGSDDGEDKDSADRLKALSLPTSFAPG